MVTLSERAGAPAGEGGVASAETARLRARVRRARGGDREAFGDLYRRYGRLVHGILLARVPAAEVPDLVQDVFLAAFERLPGLRDPSAFLPWLSTLARRAAADRHRSPRHRRESPAEAPPAPAAPPELTAEGLAALQALSQLPEAYREPLVLRLVEGMSGREIAAATGLTEGSVRVNLSRGMKRLREALEGGRNDR